MEITIVEEWSTVEPPPAPLLDHVTADPTSTALLVLDVQCSNCDSERRPRCARMLPYLAKLLGRVRAHGVPVIYTLTRGATLSDVRPEVAPLPGEPAVASGVDKFFRTELEGLLDARSADAVILVGTSAHGAVLHTATGAALRGIKVIVPVDCMASDAAYAEQYTTWHLVNAPGTRRHATLTRAEWIDFA